VRTGAVAPPQVVLGGLGVDLLTRADLLAAVAAHLPAGGPPLLVASANLDHLDVFGGDRPLPAPRGAGRWLVLLDGRPLVWAARLLTGRRWEQLAGSDLLPAVLEVARDRGARVGFLGGRPEVQRALADRLADRPGLRVSGWWAPARADLADPAAMARLAAAVRAAGTDLLVVALGKPRQEEWLARHAADAGIGVGVAFGGALDFLAGTSPRASRALRVLGLEWAHRLARDPRRLWRRYVLRAPVAAWRLAVRSPGARG